MAFKRGSDVEREVALDGTGKDGEQEQEQRPEAKDTPKIRKAIAAAFKRIEEIDADRKAANADKQAQFEHLASMGVPKKSAAAAYKRYLIRNDADLESYDFAFALCCRAVGVAIQEDLLGKK